MEVEESHGPWEKVRFKDENINPMIERLKVKGTSSPVIGWRALVYSTTADIRFLITATSKHQTDLSNQHWHGTRSYVMQIHILLPRGGLRRGGALPYRYYLMDLSPWVENSEIILRKVMFPSRLHLLLCSPHAILVLCYLAGVLDVGRALPYTSCLSMDH